jgi:hypothetical protein
VILRVLIQIARDAIRLVLLEILRVSEGIVLGDVDLWSIVVQIGVMMRGMILVVRIVEMVEERRSKKVAVAAAGGDADMTDVVQAGMSVGIIVIINLVVGPAVMMVNGFL